MNKLIPGARFSVRAAREQRYRAARALIGDGDAWSRAAQALHRNDPDGRKLAKLFKKVRGGG